MTALTPLHCHLIRGRKTVAEQFVVNVPADPAGATAVLRKHLADAARADGRGSRYRLAVHDQDGTHLYDVEATP